MLDSEHPNTDQSAQAEPEPTATAPTRRRRAARRPAGPPSAVAETSAVSEVDSTGTTSPEAAPVAEAPVAEAPVVETPVAEPAPKRTRRSRAKVAEPAQEPMIAADAGVAPTPEPEPAPAVEPVPAEPEPARKTTRKRRVARPAEPVAEPPADHDEVAASLAELAHSGRARTRKAGLAQSIGLDEEATPDQVLDSLAAVIGGRLVQAEPEAAEETEEETDDSAADAAEADELLEDEDSAAEGDEAEAEAEGDDATPRRRRRRRGGRRRRRGAGEGTADAEGDGDGEESDEGEPAATEDSTADAGDEPAAEGTSRRRRRRRRRGEDSADGEDDGVDVVVRVREPRRRSSVSDEVTGIEGSTRMEAKKQRRREGRAAGRRRAPILSESEFLARRESVERTMLIRQAEDYSQIAVMEDGILVEHYVDRASATSMIGNIYLGRVQNVLPSMEAAFVDIGRGRNAVLYAGEVDWDSFGVTGADKKVEKVFKSGQQVLVQVSKDPVGAKGARLTSHISIPGRYVVYSPGGHLSGISRKLPESERKRLKSILDELIGPDASVIVRTAAEGASEDELVRDVNRLKAQWEVLEKKSTSGQAPQLLYAEPDLTVRIVRDLFTEDFATLIVDGNGAADDAYDTVQAYVEHVAPHLAERLHRWDRSEKGDIFDAHRVHEQVAKALERKVFLPSGGSLIIDRTEAMTVIDVNTGKFTGTSGNLEATVTSNNLEAAEEIVRQLRLRDIGGIIVIDFIDMVLPANRELLLRRLVECLGRDRTRHQVAEVTSLGLVQMTRKKIGTGLAEAFTVACETCKGRGYHVHDAPVASQAPADGGERESGRRGRGGNQTTRRSSRAKKEEPAKPAGPSPLMIIAHATEHAHATEVAATEPASEAVVEAASDIASEAVVEPASEAPVAEIEAATPALELPAAEPAPVAEAVPVEEPEPAEA